MKQHQISVHPIMDAMTKLDTVRVNDEDYLDMQRVRKRQRFKWVSNFVGLLSILLTVINAFILLGLMTALALFSMDVSTATIVMSIIFVVTLTLSIICVRYSRGTFDRCAAILSELECVKGIKRVTGKRFSTDKVVAPLYELIGSKPWKINAFDLYNSKDTATHSISWSLDGNSDISIWKK